MLLWEVPVSRLVLKGGALLVAGSLLLAGCANPIVADVQATPTAAPTPVPPPKPTFEVTRGSITDVIQATGRVVAVQQQDLYFRVPGNLDTISVKLQDQVKKGQVLASLDTSTLKKQIAQQQAAVDAAKLDLQKAQATMTNTNAGIDQDIASADAQVQSAQAALDAQQAKLNAMANPTQSDIAKAQAGVSTAQATLATAQLKLQQLQAGPSAADQQKAQAAVAAAQAGLTSAQLELQQLQAGPNGADSAKAQAAVVAAQTALDAAKQKLAVLQSGPTATDVALAKGKLQSAQEAFNQAQATYQAFQNGPSPADQQKAQLAVTTAKNSLYAAQVARDKACSQVSKGIGQADCEAANAAVNSAQTTLDAAQQALAQLGTVSATDKATALAKYQQAQADLATAQAAYQAATQGAAPSDLAQARDTVTQDQAALQAAQQALAALAPTKNAVAQGQQDVAKAQAALDAARAEQAALAPTKDEIAAAQQDVASAQAGVDAAQAAFNAVVNPSPDAIRQQQDAVTQAASAVQQAQDNAKKLREVASAGNTNTIDLAIYQKKVDQAQLQLDAYNDQLAQNQIVAPFDGIVIAANGNPCDKVNAYTAVITVANPQTLQIAVSVPQDQLPKVAVGQTANIVMDAFPGRNIDGKVSQLPSVALASSNQNDASPGAAASQAQQAQGTVIDTSPKVTPVWPGPGAELGQLARVTITVQKKDDVLKIPTSAVNKINNRTFVLLDDNGRQTPVDITIGIQTDQETEVLSGLQAGQKVFSRGL